jgi:hypothetical protein
VNQHMNTLRRIIITITVLLLGSAGITAGTGRPAWAVTCSGYGCDNVDPIASGCSADAYTVTSGRVYDFNHGNQYLGIVELRYSPKCGTNWTRVTSAIGVTYLQAIVQRFYVNPIYYNDQGNYTSVWSNMVYAPSTKACSAGTIRSVIIGGICST